MSKHRNYPVKVRLFFLGKTQRQVVAELNRRGHKIDASDFGKAISGKIKYPYAEKALREAEAIISQWENEHKAKIQKRKGA